jgi:LysM repeat protein
MNFSGWFIRCAAAVLLFASVNGCVPTSQSEMEEEKEPHFLAGKNAVNGMDYPGAIEEFEKALEVNPRNSKAHYQLGWLYEEKEPDPAAAIYHYERFLKLRPNSENAEVIKQHVSSCKQDLAKTALPLPITPSMQRQIEQVLEENKRLKEENEKWKIYFSSRPQTPTNSPSVQGGIRSTTAQAVVSTSPPPVFNSQTSSVNSGSLRKHVVQGGETAASIARKYGVRLDTLLSANPGLEPRRMRVGQTLNIPAQ